MRLGFHGLQAIGKKVGSYVIRQWHAPSSSSSFLQSPIFPTPKRNGDVDTAAVPAPAITMSTTHMESLNRRHFVHSARSTSKRRRVDSEPEPEPEYISLVSDDEEEQPSFFVDLGPQSRSSPRHDWNAEHNSQGRTPSGGVPSRRMRQAAPRPSFTAPSHRNTQYASGASDKSFKQGERDLEREAERLVVSEVDRLMVGYLQGIPTAIYGKKAKYYVVWNGRRCGIFMDWPTCEAQTKQFPRAGYRGEKSYDEARQLLRSKLMERLLPETFEKLRIEARHLAPIQSYRQTSDDQCYQSPSPSGDDRYNQQVSPQWGFGDSNTRSSATDVAEELGDKDFEREVESKQPPLCEEQQAAMDLAMEGHNLFITGSGGCGKSVLVKALFEKFQALKKQVYLVAPTGQAALNIGGRTTFSYAGWTPDDMKKPFKEVLPRAHGRQVWKRLSETDVLIIDEISMVENRFLDRFSRFMCEARSDPRPMGGVQVIAVGDFCQLPPAIPFEHCASCSKKLLGRSEGKYYCPDQACDLFGETFPDQEKWAFRSSEWDKCNFEFVHLTKIHRQQDEEFIGILQKCRLGVTLNRSEIDLLLNHDCEVENGVRLYGRRMEVDARNSSEFNRLPGKSYQFWCLDTFVAQHDASGESLHAYSQLDKSPGSEHAPHFQRPLQKLKEHRYSTVAMFKLNMPVILLSNINLERGLCNGSQGIICGFVDRSEVEEPKCPKSGNYKDNPAGHRAAMRRYHEIMEFMSSPATPTQYPKVQFANGARHIIGPDCMVSEIGAKHPYSLLSRTQIPLAPGWAITVHKSQSLSLERVIVDLGSSWEKGQAYVALSRARSLRGLKVLGLTPTTLNSKFQLDPMVGWFMKKLEAKKEETAQTPQSQNFRQQDLRKPFS